MLDAGVIIQFSHVSWLVTDKTGKYIKVMEIDGGPFLDVTIDEMLNVMRSYSHELSVVLRNAF